MTVGICTGCCDPCYTDDWSRIRSDAAGSAVGARTLSQPPGSVETLGRRAVDVEVRSGTDVVARGKLRVYSFVGTPEAFGG